jgi:hypothetical protein
MKEGWSCGHAKNLLVKTLRGSIENDAGGRKQSLRPVPANGPTKYGIGIGADGGSLGAARKKEACWITAQQAFEASSR